MARLDQETIEAAAEWFTELRDVSPDDPRMCEHQAWLLQDEAHQLAWRRVEKLQNLLSSEQELITSQTFAGARASRRQVIKALSILIATGGSGVLAWKQSPWSELDADFYTATGEQRKVTLSDGSELHLNTATAIDLHFDKAFRALFLRTGEVWINTARDNAERSFIVHTPQGYFRALGTQFVLRVTDTDSYLHVFEHSVEVIVPAAMATGSKTVTVPAGKQVQVADNKISSMADNHKHLLAWQKGLLIVSDWTVQTFITELSRYHNGKISLDGSAAQLRISGIFQLKDTHAILHNLSATLPVEVNYFSRYWAQIKKI